MNCLTARYFWCPSVWYFYIVWVEPRCSQTFCNVSMPQICNAVKNFANIGITTVSWKYDGVGHFITSSCESYSTNSFHITRNRTTFTYRESHFPNSSRESRLRLLLTIRVTLRRTVFASLEPNEFHLQGGSLSEFKPWKPFTAFTYV